MSSPESKIDLTKPSRELDALVAEKVFGANVQFLNQQSGWRIDYKADKDECNDPIMTDWGSDGYRLKRYSSDIAAAWLAVEKLRETSVPFITIENDSGRDRWYVEFQDSNGHSEADTAPLAICVAALRAVGAL